MKSRKLLAAMRRPLILAAMGVALSGAVSAQEAAAPAGRQLAPASILTRELLTDLLLAEIAGARGRLDLALETYLRLAEQSRDARLARRATEVALVARDAAAARRMAELWLALDPESPDAQRVLASLSGGAGALEEVLPHLERVLAEAGDSLPGTLLGLNQVFARHPDKQAARELVERLTEPYLQLPEAHLARAQAAWIVADPDGTLVAIEDALARRPDWEPAVLFKAQVLQGNSAEAARDLLRAYLERHPESARVRLAHARSLVATRQLSEARAAFDDILRGEPDNPDNVYAVAVLSMQLKDYERAEALFRQGLQLGRPEPDVLRMHLGQLEDERGRPQDAVQWFSQVRAPEQQPEALVRSAAALARGGQLAQARALLQGGQGGREEVRRYRLAEAQLLRDAGRLQEAYDFLDALLRVYPDDPDLLYETAMLAERLGQLPVMEGRIRKLLVLEPEHAHAYNALGYVLVERGERLDEADVLLQRALQLQPDDPFILDSVGWLHFRRGDLPGALAHLQKAYEIRRDPEIAAHLGEVLWLMGREADARKLWQEAAAEHPDNRPLADVIRRFAR